MKILGNSLLIVAILLALGGQCASAAPLRATKIAAGATHACALLDDGSVKCWGDNSYGQLGLGDDDYRGDAPGEMGDDLPAVDLDSANTTTQVSAGANHTCALYGKGVVKCWGDNSYGQLGLGDEADRGDAPGEMGANLPAVWLSDTHAVTKIVSGGAHNCALLDDGSVKCWGENSSGQLGQGHPFNRGNTAFEMGTYLSAVDLGTGRTAVQIDAGLSHSCALLDDDTVKCWGNNAFGQLGYGDTANRGDDQNEMGNSLPAIDLGPGRTAKKIATGYSHTCALLDNDRVKCWGRNSWGQLGYGDIVARGDNAGEMGNNLSAVSFGFTLNPVTRIIAGANHNCVLLDTHLRCWGQNADGQLGLGDQSNRGDDAGEMGIALANIDVGVGRHAVQVAGGWNFTCARLDNNRVKCWGNNLYGQLGQGDTLHRGVNPGEVAALTYIDLGTQ